MQDPTLLTFMEAKQLDTPPFKTFVSEAEASSVLQGIWSGDFANIEEIQGGECSQAFFFDAKGVRYVLKIRNEDTPLIKEQIAYSEYGSTLPIPKVLHVGSVRDGLFYLISEAASGKTLKFHTLEGYEVSAYREDLLTYLKNLYSTNINHTSGYGPWESTVLKAKWSSWRANIMSIVKNTKQHNWDDLIKNYGFPKELYEELRARVFTFLPDCPEERYIFHGDTSFNNILGKNGKITGLIDWEHAGYGDYLYDIAHTEFWHPHWKIAEHAFVNFTKSSLDTENFFERLECYIAARNLGTLAYLKRTGQEFSFQHIVGRIKNRKRFV